MRFFPARSSDWVPPTLGGAYLILIGLSPLFAAWLFDKYSLLLLSVSIPLSVLGILGLAHARRLFLLRHDEVRLDGTGIHLLRSGAIAESLSWQSYAGFRWRGIRPADRPRDRRIHSAPEAHKMPGPLQRDYVGLEILDKEGSPRLFIPVPAILRRIRPHPGLYGEPQPCSFAGLLAVLEARSEKGRCEPLEGPGRSKRLFRRFVTGLLLVLPSGALVNAVLRNWSDGTPLHPVLQPFSNPALLWIPLMMLLVSTAVACMALIRLVLPRGMIVEQTTAPATELSRHFVRTGGQPCDLSAPGTYRYAAADEVEPRLRKQAREGSSELVFLTVIFSAILALFIYSALTGNPTATFWTGLGIFGMFGSMLLAVYLGYRMGKARLESLHDVLVSDGVHIQVERDGRAIGRFLLTGKSWPFAPLGTEILANKKNRYLIDRVMLHREDTKGPSDHPATSQEEPL